MTRIAKVLTGISLLVAVLAGCDSSSVPRAGNSTTTRAAPTPAAKGGVASSTAGIDAAVVRQLVTTDGRVKDGTLRAIYVIDGAVPGAGNPLTWVTRPKQGFDAGFKAELRAALADLPPLTFVSDRSVVVAGTPPGHVIHDGVLVTLGPVRGSGTRVEVASSSWVNGQDGRWLTYVLGNACSGWTVVGTTGPMSIS